MPRVHQLVGRSNCVQRASSRSVRVLFRQQVGLENGFQDQHRRRLNHAIRDGRDPQRPFAAIGLRDHHPTYRLWAVRLIPETFRQSAQPRLHALRFDLLERHTVHARDAAVGSAAVVGMVQHVHSIDLVVQGVEPKAWRLLRFGVQRRLQFLNRWWGC